MPWRVLRVAGCDIVGGGTEGSRGCTVWIGEGGRDREYDRGPVGRVCDRVVFDAGDRAGDASHHELSPRLVYLDCTRKTQKGSGHR